MKIQASQKALSQGSALVITMVLGVIMLIIVGSYLQMMGTQKTLVVRSETWNGSLCIVEAGVEGALSQMNATPNFSPPNDFSANGWGRAGIVNGPVARTLQ